MAVRRVLLSSRVLAGASVVLFNTTADNLFLAGWWMSPETYKGARYLKLTSGEFAFTNLNIAGVTISDSLSGINLIIYATEFTVVGVTLTPDLLEDPAIQEELHTVLGDPFNTGSISLKLAFLIVDGQTLVPPEMS